MTGRHVTAELSFMLVGHTKFAPDRYFGLLKKRYRRSCVDTIVDIACVVKESTTTGHNIPQLIRSHDGVKHVQFYQWKVFQFFKSIPNILKMDRFFVDAAKPGVVAIREIGASMDTAINILKVDHQSIIEAGMPEQVQVKGLDLHRQWYLYEQIRPFCKNNLSADYTCPKPTCAKPDSTPQLTTISAPNVSQENVRAKRKCSQCKEVGHTKRTCTRNN